MWTIKEFGALAHVSVRTLHHYDSIGLLKPTSSTDAGYRLYDEAALHRLRLILLYRELGFSLRAIGELLSMPEDARLARLEHRTGQLEQQHRHLQNRIFLAKQLIQLGVNDLNLEVFDPTSVDDLEEQVKVLWGKTEAYQQYTEKAASRTKIDSDAINTELMNHFVRLGQLRNHDPADSVVQNWVSSLQAYLSANYYNCTKQILRGLGQMYAGGGSMTEHIDRAGGAGTAALAGAAIELYCK